MRNVLKLTAVAAIAALFTSLSACATPAPTPTASLPPASPTTTAVTPSASASASASPVQADTLGPFGYGALKIGATKAEAKASGLAEGISGSKGQCGGTGDGWLKGAQKPTDENIGGTLFFSATTGKLISIYAYGEVATPEGIKLGSTVAELKAAFGNWGAEDGTEGRGYEKAKGNSKASYRIVVNNGKVTELSLDSVGQDCYE